ncbi:hypothetical protein K7X08_029767 [Anisodus acutangulus]|uniref:Uncharacterized protein n=1 Tax=Anisodus acutangulus TaxID=402998 RepID=A0A9Q1MBY1_9SOLA|nr:hypothetical protein K7X08_029767 [Anisodus acutangulus]
MASVHCCARPFQVNLGFHRPLRKPQTSFITFQFHTPKRDAFPAHFNFRFNNVASVHLRQRLLPISRSSTNPSGGSDKSTDASGPPLATILAGVLVFCVVGWIVGSIRTFVELLVSSNG